jgi:maltooligosyltrehalose synthase
MAEVEALKAYKAHKQAISDAARVKYYEIKAAREAKAATTQKEVS